MKFASTSHGAPLGSRHAMEAVIRPILLIDDDTSLCSLMREFFLDYGFKIDAVHHGDRGLARALEYPYDLVILDVMLPGIDGFEVLRQIRRRSAVPVILLTARTEQSDRIAGLDAGADDYLSKPFGPHELVARVRAVLRRTDNPSSHISPPVQFGELTLDSQRREVRNGDESIELTSVEFAILDVLMRSPGRIVSRSELSAVLYQRDTTPFERAIDVHISHLRKKLDSNGSVSIRSIRGIGYTLIGKKEDA